MESTGFEFLLKPVQDNSTSNWEILLTPFLEKYVDFLQNETMNFPQAGLLLQNSTKFYCKRVDILFKEIENLAFSIKNNKSQTDENQEDPECQKAKRGRRKPKSLESDDLEILGFVSSDHNIKLNREKAKLLVTDELKCTFLNSAVRVILKPNTSSRIYQLNGSDLGLKNEFRLQWHLFSDGSLNEDLAFSSQNKVTCATAEDYPQELNNSLDDDFDNEMRCSMNMEIDPVDTVADPTTIVDPTINLPTPVEPTIIPPVPMETEIGISMKKRKQTIDPWAVISDTTSFFTLKLRVKNVLKIPERFKKKNKNEEPINLLHVNSYHNTLDSNNLQSFNTKVFLTKLESQERNKNLLKKRRETVQETVQVEQDALGLINDDGNIQDCEINDCSHFFDSFDNDNEPVELSYTARQDMFDQDFQEQYIEATKNIMNKFRENKRQYAVKATEIAKRVAEWHDSIMPALEASEKRTNFDIKEYGTKILNKFPDGDTTTYRPFESIIEGQPNVEICRYFLSTLMLANTYNLDIRNSNPSELATNCLELKLITKIRHQDELNANLQATSSGSNAQTLSNIQPSTSNANPTITHSHKKQPEQPSKKKKKNQKITRP